MTWFSEHFLSQHSPLCMQHTSPIGAAISRFYSSEDFMIWVLKKLLYCSNYFIICAEVIPMQVFLHIEEEGVV